MFESGTKNTTLKYKLLFLLNLHEGAKKDEIDAITNENKKHLDMLVPNVEDNYHTVGLKLLSSFNWINELENKIDLKWIMKIDDDMMVNFTKLDDYLTKENI